MTPAEYKLELAKTGRKPRKYRNTPTVVDGIRFDSKAEANRWCTLKLLEKAGAISDLQRQVVYPIHIDGVQVTRYIPDFVYIEYGQKIVEDVKSPQTAKTRLFQMKVKMMWALYGIKVQVVQ